MANEAQDQDFVSKLTIKTLGVNPKDVLSKITSDAQKIAVCRIFGNVQRVGFEEDRVRGATYTYFVGAFGGINMLDGVVLQSSKLYLPNGISELVEGVFTRARAKSSSLREAIEFIVEISVGRNKQSSTGYGYHAAFLQKPQETDALASLREIATAKPAKKTA